MRKCSGFTLIELMIVVVIIGILAALAIPRFMRAAGKSKQSEAKELLKQIYVMEQTYFVGSIERAYFIPVGNFGSVYLGFDPDIPELGIEFMPSAHYKYVWRGVSTVGFTCIATANLDDDLFVDEWYITHTGELVPAVDDTQL